MPQYIEITCISLINGHKNVCGRYMGDLRADSKDGNFRCPRCRKVWNIEHVSRGTLIYTEASNQKEYLDNVIKIEEKILSG